MQDIRITVAELYIEGHNMDAISNATGLPWDEVAEIVTVLLSTLTHKDSTDAP